VEVFACLPRNELLPYLPHLLKEEFVMRKAKIVSLFSFLLVLSLLVAACSGPETAVPPAAQEDPPAAEAPPAETEPESEAAEESESDMVADSGIDCHGAQPGDEVTMLYQWSGVEEENLNRILQPLIEACGIRLSPESSRDQGLLDTRVQAGTPPDIVFWTFRQAQQYQDRLVPLSELGVHSENYASFWQEMGTLDGQWIALPVKADPKTLIWYSPANFEAFGYDVPETWDELEALVEQMVADGNVPWSMGLESGDATGWTGSDFIQDILHVHQGHDYVRGIINGSIPYNDAGVQEAFEMYGKWATDPAYTVGGAQGTLSTQFLDAIYKVFSDPPEAMMVKQSGFAGGAIDAQFPELTYGVDYDFFQVPGADSLQGGTSWMMAFSDKPAVQAIFAYLSSDMGGQKWAEVGFDLTPNSAGNDYYTDPALIKKAEMLANADDFVPDLGDTIPGGFGNAEWRTIIDFINGEDLMTVLTRAAEVQADALSQ
jgi:alpha-glucoside transport system substrate-binding protein